MEKMKLDLLKQIRTLKDLIRMKQNDIKFFKNRLETRKDLGKWEVYYIQDILNLYPKEIIDLQNQVRDLDARYQVWNSPNLFSYQVFDYKKHDRGDDHVKRN